VKRIRLRCKMAGKRVTAVYDRNQDFACENCEGIIEIIEINGSRFLNCKINTYISPPRKDQTGFDCPATLARPEESDLVEVIEEWQTTTP